MSGRVVYTVLTGGYEPLMEQPVQAASSIDFVCFSDDPTITSTSWTVRHTRPALPADPVRSARRVKILAHEYLPEYQESLYIDNSVLLQSSPEEVFDALLPAGAEFAVLRHSYRGSLRDEYDAVIEAGYDSPWRCGEQLSDYQSVDRLGLEAPTIWSGLLLRRHNDPALQRAMQMWWENVLRYSRRDQLSLPVVLRAAGVVPVIHELDNNRSPFHRWPCWNDGAKRSARAWWDGPDVRIAELEGQADALRVERDRARSERNRLQAQVDVLDVDLAESEARWHSAQDGQEQLRALVDAVLSSTSWRVTRPARAVGDALKKLARHLSRRPRQSTV